MVPGGAVPMSPITAGGTAKSAAMWSYSGDSEATADRSENANSTMPTSARVLPCQSGRAGDEFTRPSLCARADAPAVRGRPEGQDSWEPSTHARYSSVTVPVM